MSFFKKLVEQGSFDFIADWADEKSQQLDELDRKVTKKLDQLGEDLDSIGDKADAVRGTGDYKNSSRDVRIRALEGKKPKKRRQVQYGDVLGINRIGGVYEHYGIYAGKNKVIHFTSMDSDLSGENEIMETKMSHFLRDEKEFFILDFEPVSRHKRPEKIPVSSSILLIPDEYLIEIYSPDETVERAKSQLGKKGYSVLFNNCEHFVIWCKTGVHKSYQIDDILEEVTPVQQTVTNYKK